MAQYRFEVKVTGWMTRLVEADNLEDARDIAAEVDWNMTIGDLRWKQTEVEDYED